MLLCVVVMNCVPDREKIERKLRENYMNLSELTKEQLSLVANTIRMLSADAVERANSGHPGMPMGMAECGTALFLKYLRFHPENPKWINRDRFVLSNGHGSMLLYSLLHLCGYAVSLDDLKKFRRWGSITPGHPESHMTPGVECTTGPLGQGISNAVGMAIGAKVFSSRYNTEKSPIIDGRVFCFTGDGCLMEGVSSEASSLAGHLGLGNLIVVYDDNHISIAGHTRLAFTEDVLKRYEAYGWHVQRIDGHNVAEIDRALELAIGETARPSIIAARTIIGKGSPNKADTHDVHGAPLGKDELLLTKKELHWPLEPEFYIPKEVSEIFAARRAELAKAYEQWEQRFTAWQGENKEKATKLQHQLERRVPLELQAKLLAALPLNPGPAATRKLSQSVLQVVSHEVPAVLGGSADLEPSTLTLINDSSDVSKTSFSGVNLRFGVREHAMGSVMNGLAYYGGFIPYGSTFLCFADYMRPAIRLAAISHLPGMFIFTHDSVFLGEDGPTHQPIEHLGALRMIPNLWVIRPADGMETAVAYEMALRRKDGPCCLIFTRQNLDPIERHSSFDANIIKHGGYSVYDSRGGTPSVVIVATGSEVPLAVAAAKLLAETTSIRVLSMPCYEVFAEQPAEYRKLMLPDSAKKVVLEAGTTKGWPSMIEASPRDGLFLGIDHYGASAPFKDLAENFGFTKEQVAKKIREKFSL